MSEMPEESARDEIESVQPVRSSLAPGVALKQAREAAGLGVDEVARMLKFSPRQIHSLEADDYVSLQGATFVRGFIRSYAKLLKIDAAPLLAQVAQAANLQPAQVIEPDNMGEASPKPLLERFQRTLLVFAVLLAVGVVAAYAYLKDKEGFLPATESEPAPRAEEKVEPPAANPVVPPAPEPANGAPSTPAGASAVPAAPAATVAPVASPVVAAAPTASSAPQTVPAVPPAPAEQQIVLEFSGKSWVEIKDASKRVVFTGEYTSGRQVATGKAPFQLWIGKASGVKVSYGDRKVDLVPYTRDEVARLTLE